MERLTETRGGTVYYIGVHTQLPGLECAGTMRVAAIRDVMQRLAEYEATGLAPEEINSKPVAVNINPYTFPDKTIEALHRMDRKVHGRA